eukprot:c11183_g1_i1 orf=283-1146(-)
MFSVEFFDSCNITHKDAVSQALLQVHGGKFLLTKSRGDTAYKISFTKELHVRHLRVSKWGPSRLTKGAARSTASVSAENGSTDGASGLYFGQITQKEELAALRESSMRANLMKKLSDANMYGRHLQRQLLEKEDALLKCKSELVTMETEMKALVSLAQEVASEGGKPGMRKINGKYIPSHLAVRLEELHERLLLQAQSIEAVCYRDVPFAWVGMAEDVQVMGSFDGWTQGLQLSPENTGSFTKFSATVKLRTGRYQIKFLVDGEWHVSPDLPLVGEGPNINNLLVVE